MPFGSHPARRGVRRGPESSGWIGADGRRGRRGNNGSAPLPGTHRRRCRACHDDEIPSRRGVRSVPVRVPVAVLRNLVRCSRGAGPVSPDQPGGQQPAMSTANTWWAPVFRRAIRSATTLPHAVSTAGNPEARVELGWLPTGLGVSAAFLRARRRSSHRRKAGCPREHFSIWYSASGISRDRPPGLSSAGQARMPALPGRHTATGEML